MLHPPSAAEHEAALQLVSGFSLEMTGKDVPALAEAASVIPAGTRINVTYLAGEDMDTRVAAAEAVRENGFVPVPHLSARRIRSRQELEAFLGRLRDVGAADRVLVVGGDPAEPEGPYPDSLSLIRTGLFEEYGVREVSITGYPEGHPDIPGEELWSHLEAKSAELRQRGLAGSILTQFAFDTDPVIAWVRAVRNRGIDAEVRIGVPGPAGVKRLLGFARRFGVGANAMIVKKYGFSLSNLLSTAGPDAFVKELAGRLQDEGLGEGVAVHLYTFGGLRSTAEWAEAFIERQNRRQ